MANLKNPPFHDNPNPDDRFWSQSWFEWLRDITMRVNERIASSGTGTANNFVKYDASGNLDDSGKSVPTGAVVGTTDSQALSNKSLTSPVLNAGVSGTAVLDEDTMASNSATKLATQQSIKAYVDTRTGTGTDNHFAEYDSLGNLSDSGKTVPSGDVVGTTDAQCLTNKTAPEPTAALGIANKEYCDTTFLIEAPLDEAGTETGHHIGDHYFEGDIETGGTVDTRDVAADGAKLDGIEAGAEINEIEGDGTNGRVLRQSILTIADGTNPATLNCQLVSLWNGDADGPTDNVAKGATTGNYTLDGVGVVLKVEAATLSGNCVMAMGTIGLNISGVAGLTAYVAGLGNDIHIETYNESGIAQDLTTLVDTGTIKIMILYMTSA